MFQNQTLLVYIENTFAKMLRIPFMRRVAPVDQTGYDTELTEDTLRETIEARHVVEAYFPMYLLVPQIGEEDINNIDNMIRNSGIQMQIAWERICEVMRLSRMDTPVTLRQFDLAIREYMSDYIVATRRYH